jgi:N-formylglutamate amidohydrolase
VSSSTFTLLPLPNGPSGLSGVAGVAGVAGVSGVSGAPAAVLAGPVVVSIPHAGLEVPAEDADVLAISGRGLLRDADLHVEKLASGIPALGVPVVVGQVSRYVLDLNRSPDDVDADVCPAVERPARSSPRGLCWRTATDGTAVLRRPLTVAEVRSRVQRIHAPYHDALRALLAERKARFGHAVLLDLHSMPSRYDSPARRVDVVPGTLDDTSCAPALLQLVVDHFTAAELSVRPNDPYKGQYTTAHHGRPTEGVHALQLELNRDLYMDERTFALVEHRAARLRALLVALVTRMGQLPLS